MLTTRLYLLMLTLSASPLAQTGDSYPAAQSAVTLPSVHPDGSAIEYDVVSIHVNKSGRNGMSIRRTDDAFQATNILARTLISEAYGKREDLIEGLPKWAETTHFDVIAKITSQDPMTLKKLSRPQKQAMLATVLADYFSARAHLVTSSRPVYRLVVGKSGTKIKASQERDIPGSLVVNDGEIRGVGVPMAYLVDPLSQVIGRTVIDSTALSGRYDLQIRWTPDEAAGANTGLDDISIFTAIQEQTGLKLEPSTGPVEMLVIDRLEMPRET